MMGEYLTNAYELYFLRKKSPLLDVNMARVIGRLYGLGEKINIRNNFRLHKLSSQIVSHLNTKKINWAILDPGAIISSIREPKCNRCPLRDFCKYFKANTI
jgi:A/G-specific adenine glycosylase